MAYNVTNGVTDFSRPVCPYPALPRYSGVGDTTKASSFVCADESERDDNQPPPKYLNDGDDYPIVLIDDRDHDHDRENRCVIRGAGAEGPLLCRFLDAGNNEALGTLS
jgi:hypothetical protein